MRTYRGPNALVALAVASAVLAAACGTSGTPRSTTAPPTGTTPGLSTTSTAAPTTTVRPTTTTAATTSTTARTSTTASCVDLSAWSVARLAAQTVAVPAPETDVAWVNAEVAAGGGGVLLFGSSAPADLGAQLNALKARAPAGLGLLVMTDEEGGGIQRMANLVGSLPWASYMGQHWSPSEITSQVSVVARRMAGYGVNTDLAPVVDVDGRNVAPGATDPDGWRSFSGTTAVVTADGTAYMRGLSDGGVIAVLKHFPGLGGATGNTDNGFAWTLPWSTLQKTALPPFLEAIEEGAPAVMVSNAAVPGLTSLPASLSPAVITQELVGALHFGGLIMTDSLTSQAVTAAGYSLPAAAVQALRAGAHMVMYSTMTSPQATQQQFQQIVDAISAAVAGGTLSRARLSAAAAAVLTARHVHACF